MLANHVSRASTTAFGPPLDLKKYVVPSKLAPFLDEEVITFGWTYYILIMSTIHLIQA